MAGRCPKLGSRPRRQATAASVMAVPLASGHEYNACITLYFKKELFSQCCRVDQLPSLDAPASIHGSYSLASQALPQSVAVVARDPISLGSAMPAAAKQARFLCDNSA